MGILVADSKTFNNGLTLNNFVISVKGSLRGIEKRIIYDDNGTPSTLYVIFYTAYYYATEAAYNSKACYLDSISDTISLTDEQITTNIFARIYEQISSNYNNVTNIL